MSKFSRVFRILANLRRRLEWGRGPQTPLSQSSFALVSSRGEGHPRVHRCAAREIRAEHPRTRERGREIAGDDERARASAEEMRPASGKDAGTLNSSAHDYPVGSGPRTDLSEIKAPTGRNRIHTNSAIQSAEDTAPRSSAVVGAPSGRSYKRGLAGCVAVALGLFLAATPQAFALSKHTYSTSFSGPSAAPLTNPTAVAVDSSTGDVYVANDGVTEQQTVTIEATGGSYTLGFEGKTTLQLPFDADAEAVREAFYYRGVLPGGSNFTEEVIGPETRVLTIEFTGIYRGLTQPLLRANASHLTGAAHAATVARSRPIGGGAEVEKFSPSGEFILMLGKEVNKGKVEAGGATEAAQDLCQAGEECQPGFPQASGSGAFAAPQYLAVDNSGRPGLQGDLYVGDGATGDLEKFDPSGVPIATWGEAGLLSGAPNRPPFLSRNGPGKAFGGIAVDTDGNLYVAAEARGTLTNQIYKFDAAGGFLVSLDYGVTLGLPNGIAIGAAGTLYLGTSGITVLPSLTELLSSPPNQLIARISDAADALTVDPLGNEVFATRSDGSVEQFAPACEAPFGENDPLPRCVPFETFGSGNLSQPQGIAVDPSSGAVYVADAGDHRVAVFTATPNLPDLLPAADPATPSSERLSADVDPAGGGPVSACHFQYLPKAAGPANAVQSLTIAGATSGAFTLTARTAVFQGDLEAGSSIFSHAERLSGLLNLGDALSGHGLTPGTTLSGNSGPYELSSLPTASTATTLTATETTGSIPYEATPEELQAALEALPGIGAGNVTVTGSPGGPYTIEFKGELAGLEVPTLGADSSGLAPAGEATLTTSTEGGPWGKATVVPCSQQAISSKAEVSAEPEGLTYGSDYRMRVLVAAENGTEASYSQPFTTLPLAPSVEAEFASAVRADTALIHARISPGGGETTYRVRYLTQEEWEAGQPEPWSGAAESPPLKAGSARTPQSLTAQLSALQPNTAYRYRVVATNANTTTAGAEHAFSTLPHTAQLADALPQRPRPPADRRRPAARLPRL